MESGSAPADLLRGAIVIVGAGYPGSGDIHRTPLSAAASGMDLHANAIATLVDGREIHHTSRWIAFLAALLAALSAACLTLRRHAAIALLMAAALSVLYLSIAFAAFVWKSTFLPVAGPTLAFSLSAAGVLIARGIRDRTLRNRIQLLFGVLVSPAVRDYVMSHPEVRSERGFTVEATILFLDIRGFTSKSETTPAPVLVDRLNRLFARLIHCIESNSGLVLHFLGDGFVACFGAPVPSSEHAQMGVLAARQVLQALSEHNSESVAFGESPWEIGVGIHSGPVLCGYVGGGDRFQFTVMGDTVNTASRLQDMCKDLGKPVVVSQATLDLLGATVESEGPYEMRAKGKNAQILVHTIESGR
jgi:adenylate cyclase